MKKFILIDGHALIFKMYYAFIRRPMVNSKGVDTSILFGFTKTLLDLLIKERPSHFAVAFDPPAKTFRHQIFPNYKANRSETPELIKSSLEPLCEILEAISVPVLMKEGYEADDVIGTFAKLGEEKGFKVFMVSPDKDYGQLVSSNIFQYKPGKSGTPDELLGKEEICKIYNIEEPTQVIDILTIWGDSSDNIPGVRGIGEVGSKKLISQYGSVENIYEHLEQLTPKQRDAFIEAKEHIALSKRLVTIETSVDLPWEESKLEIGTPNFSAIIELFKKYEFASLEKMLPNLQELFSTSIAEVEEIESGVAQLYRPWEISSPQMVISAIKESGYLSFTFKEETTYLGSSSLALPLPNPIPSQFAELFADEKIIKVGYSIKSLFTLLIKNSIKLNGPLADIELMHYVLTPERSHKLTTLAQSYLGFSLPQEEISNDLFTTAEGLNHQQEATAELPLLYPLYQKLKEELKRESLRDLYYNIEMPLIEVLGSMEYLGVKIDTQMLIDYSRELTLELNTIEAQVRELAEEPNLNLSSPKQIGILLYEKLKLVNNAKKSSKKNYSTDEESLTSIIDKHPIVPLILEFRNLKKLLSTYIDPLPTLISSNSGKVHTTYNQALTSTGRLSSIKPNLQNIPIRTKRGREIRKAFIPSQKSGVIMSADYSQIELRLMAHMSKDSHFIEAFNLGKDIHAATAAKIFGVSESQLTKEQRERAKVANFGIIYGISAFGLSQRLAISRNDSKKLIDDYFLNYPKVEEYMREMIERAKRDGFVTTLYGRKRYLPNIDSKNPVVRGLSERNAINAPIQGSAADIIKVAMINVYNRINREKLTSRMILQVHDELVFDAIESETETLSQLVKEEMEGVIELSVPLIVDCKWGSNWLEAN